MIGSIVFGSFSLVFCFLFCWFRTHKANVYSLALKIVSSFCFIMCALFAISDVSSSSFNLLVVAGLVLGLIGDILLDLKIMYPQQKNHYFIAGTLSFSLGHVFYFLATLLFASKNCPASLVWIILASIGIALLSTSIIMLLSKKMGMNFGKMLYVVVLYSLVLTFMTSLCIAVAIFSPIFWVFAGGMIAFLLSDLILSMQYFGNRDEKIFVYINHVLYYLAQIALAISLLFCLI